MNRQLPHQVCEGSSKLACAPRPRSLGMHSDPAHQADACGAPHFTARNLTSLVFERLPSCGVVRIKQCRSRKAWGKADAGSVSPPA